MSNVVRFDCFELDLESGQLLKHGTRIRLRDQSFQVLSTLLERPGKIVTRDALRQRLWHGDVFVDFDNNLNAVIARLRETLGDSAARPRFIETLPRRGYRFRGTVSQPAHAVGDSAARRNRLVVLPFVNLSGDPAKDYLSEATTDETITALAGLARDQLAIIARTTAMRYKGSPKDVARIGRELALDYVVEGGVRCVGDRATINIQLIQVSDQAHLFARRYETAQRDLVRTTTRAAHDLAACLGMTSVPKSVRARETARVRAVGRSAPDPGAYRDYIVARRCMDRITANSLSDARRYLKESIRRDPEFAAAYDALAETYWHLGYYGFLRPREAFATGILYAVRALEIDNTRAETHALLAQFHKTAQYDWCEVHREMALARQLDENSPIVRVRYAVSDLMPHGRLEEAIAELDRAVELDPLSPYARVWLSIMLLFAAEYERALTEARRVIEVDPAHYVAYLTISACERYRGKTEEAIAAQRKCVELSGEAASMLGWLGLTLASAGETAEARAILQRLHEVAVRDYAPPSSLALIYLGLRELDTAFDWLNQAVDQCDQLMMPIKSYRFFDPIRSDPRFTRLVRKMNLEP